MTVVLKKLAAGLALAWFAVHALAGGYSSDGHTHAQEPPVVLAPQVSAASRLISQTEQFELVGTLKGNILTLYLDQFATNTPIEKAQIELESGSWKASATEVSPAVYTVPAQALAQPGKYPMTITLQAGDAFDLMDEVDAASEATPSSAHTHFWGEWAVWAGAGALALAALALVARRRQKYQRKHRHL